MASVPSARSRRRCAKAKETGGVAGTSSTKRLRSRHAAHNRRLNENTEFEQLSSALPVPKPISLQLLDKASVVRLTISSLNLHTFSTQGFPSWLENSCSYSEENILKLGSRILEAVDGFLMCVSDSGTILYVSETISVTLGLSQVEMVGNPFADYLHVSDFAAWYAAVGALSSSADVGVRQMALCVRLKSTLSKRARKEANRSSLGYKVVRLTLGARLENVRVDGVQRGNRLMGICCLGEALPCVTMMTLRLECNSVFVLTTRLDLSLHYVDSRLEELWSTTYGIFTGHCGISLYKLVHVDDVFLLRDLHKEVLQLGSSTGQYFRLLKVNTSVFGGGGHLWVHTTAIRIVRHKPATNSHFITFICHVVGINDHADAFDVMHHGIN